eukprot:UN13497
MRAASLDEHGQYDSRKIVGTPRTLLSILRLSQALARIRFSDVVNQSDVQEAIRLMKQAKYSTLQAEEIEKEWQDEMSRVYQIITQYFENRHIDACRIADLKTTLTTRGFSDDIIDKTLDTYQENDIWYISADGEAL